MSATPTSDNLLDVGETWQYTASHTVTQAELDAGTNHRQHGDGDRRRGDPGQRRRLGSGGAEQDPAHREGRDGSGRHGELDQRVINYTLAVTNTGNAAIADVVVDDPFTTNEAPVLSRHLQCRRHRPGQSVGCQRDLAVHGQPHGDAGRARRRDPSSTRRR